jgi:hypothetical protein
MWKEIIVASIEMSAGTGGCRKGEVRWKLGNSSTLISQSTLMIKKRIL